MKRTPGHSRSEFHQIDPKFHMAASLKIGQDKATTETGLLTYHWRIINSTIICCKDQSMSEFHQIDPKFHMAASLKIGQDKATTETGLLTYHWRIINSTIICCKDQSMSVCLSVHGWIVVWPPVMCSDCRWWTVICPGTVIKTACFTK